MGEPKTALFLSAGDYFREAVDDAVKKRKVETTPLAVDYLVRLLEHYISAENLFQVEDTNGQKRADTLAEMMLKAANSERMVRVDLLKRLGDVSLYVSGFFGDSLNRKVVDIDYYADMGGLAYGTLASEVRDEEIRKVYSEFAQNFLEYVDVLTIVSHNAMIQTDQNLLRLYERYVKTGSEVAKEHLLEKGIIPLEAKKAFKQ